MYLQVKNLESRVRELEDEMASKDKQHQQSEKELKKVREHKLFHENDLSEVKSMYCFVERIFMVLSTVLD